MAKLWYEALQAGSNPCPVERLYKLPYAELYSSDPKLKIDTGGKCCVVSRDTQSIQFHTQEIDRSSRSLHLIACGRTHARDLGVGGFCVQNKPSDYRHLPPRIATCTKGKAPTVGNVSRCGLAVRR